jgi:hypothetical protein
VVAVLVAVLGVALRKLVMAYGDELKVLWREYGPTALSKLLARRKMPQTPWYCDRCHSHNARGHQRCYACGASRADAEMAPPNADAPAGPSAGRSQRTRR